MGKLAYVTISVDDGYPADLQSAELLQRFGLKATFYIPARNPERELMAPHQIRELATYFEVGSHTFHHKPLRDLSDQEARTEICDGKRWLEDLIGRQVGAFCYPGGKFRSRIVNLVREAGFVGARTCTLNVTRFPKNPFLWGVSTQGYSHPAAVQVRHALLEKNFHALFRFVVTHRLTRYWPEHFKRALDFVEEHGGVAHLYFHSWEMEGHREWSTLKQLLESISQRRELIRVTNGDLFRLWYFRIDQKAGY
jgi:peptidoglycan/xylan/chitin deacetylase (PgdA/CDA1 family)